MQFKEPEQATKRLTIEGWRFLPHSYALVNQWQLLALLRRTEIALKVRDAPVYRQCWQAHDSLFEKHAHQKLMSLEIAEAAERADVYLKIFAPFDFSLSRSRRTAVFGTSESQTIQKNQLQDALMFEHFKKAYAPADVTVITPSKWSAEGFYKAGFKTEQVVIVPHGVDIDTFHPMSERRSELRSKLSIADSQFVFLSVGAMTGNKGIDLLLKAFAEVCRKFPAARLILKGMDPLYDSKDRLLRHLQGLSACDQQRVADRMYYFGETFSNAKMAMLYRAADAYVSPYRAEGFNLPVLEAAASGLPIVCTGGGATDDFVNAAFARRIESKKLSHTVGDLELWRVEPNLDHLIVLMASMIEDHAWCRLASDAGPAHVGANYTWDSSVDMMVRKLFEETSPPPNL